jgi:hypothetical protein
MKPFHARNTRASSSEQYLVGRGMRASAILPAPPPTASPVVPSPKV